MISNAHLSDLVNEIKQGDSDSFALFIELTQDKLIKTAFNYLDDLSTAQDVVSDFYCSLPHLFTKLKNTNNVFYWCKTIIINRSINTLKKRKREILCEQHYETASAYLNEEVLTESIFVRNILRKLDEKQRIVLLYRTYGFTLHEIASMINCSIKKVRILLEKGKENFIKMYEYKGH